MPAIAEQTTAQHMPQTGPFMMFPPNSVSNSQPGFRSVLGLAWSFNSKVLRATTSQTVPIGRRTGHKATWEMSE